MWLPIDTNVLVDASGQGMHEYAGTAHDLLRRLLEVPTFRAAIDAKRKLQREYENRINSNMYAHHWLTRLYKEQRIASVGRVIIPKGAVVQLLEGQLHKEDFHLVEAALGSDRIIVTRDFNSFQPHIITILRRTLGIRVLSPAEMIACLDQPNPAPAVLECGPGNRCENG